MDYQPYQFMLHHGDDDLKRLLGFKHRTFNDTDLLYFVAFFKQHYQQSITLETAFLPQNHLNNDHLTTNGKTNKQIDTSANELVEIVGYSTEKALNHFRSYFFSLPDFPHRTIKHISSPLQKSTCKRLNMFLRWMVRNDNCGVDFGLWNTIKPSALICPCDVHVDRVARKLGLITRKQTDWLTAIELTENLSRFDVVDPVKYDFALFGLGVEEKF
jgi:uncharacterized protein (TIGR02757 family)